ncbi:MAG: Asp-tRNA(Asn)/Glu-tRNA(Gln) amidotransferase subunit GatC [Candidatus Pacebacteria bacterium]|nr:Asp-tRNA(Asn)/Glu-tRNA(Gln) amidotransferase subunit GatC [Candidatus Paceibacterota bacterium]MDR3583035.1 Asp-tRNA(Asn)/Glu-tRNA(Gln) amidotransferase subunit GatC [Candidatus Paceibacterota bacterium]
MLSKDEVKHIAALARVGLSEVDIEKFQKDLSGILDFVEQLKEVDVDGVEPAAHITGLTNRTREDRAENFENKEGIVKLFPEEKDGYDKVKSVL